MSDINIQVALDSIKLAQYNQTQWFGEMKHHQQTKDLHHTLQARYRELEGKISESRKVGIVIGFILGLTTWALLVLVYTLVM